MANIKSAKKRILVTETRAARNKSIRSEVKTAIKKVEAAVAANDKEAAKAALTVAISTIESASSKGVYHKNNAGRKAVSYTHLDVYKRQPQFFSIRCIIFSIPIFQFPKIQSSQLVYKMVQYHFFSVSL